MDPDPDPDTCELRELALPKDQQAVPDFNPATGLTAPTTLIAYTFLHFGTFEKNPLSGLLLQTFQYTACCTVEFVITVMGALLPGCGVKFQTFFNGPRPRPRYL